MISAVTWNTQGDPRNDLRKKLYLDSLLSIWRYDFILLQECGALAEETNYRGYNVNGRSETGALNNRCGTAIISRHDLDMGDDLYYGRRLGIHTQYKDVLIGTMHGTSGGVGLIDLRPFIQHLLGLGGDPNKIIVGADFNATPDQFAQADLFSRQRIDTGTSRQHGARAHTTWGRTHKSGDRLDYFVSNLTCPAGAWRSHLVFAGDHNPVTATFSEQFDSAVVDR